MTTATTTRPLSGFFSPQEGARLIETRTSRSGIVIQVVWEQEDEPYAIGLRAWRLTEEEAIQLEAFLTSLTPRPRREPHRVPVGGSSDLLG